MTVQIVSAQEANSGGQSEIVVPLDAGNFMAGDSFVVVLRHQSASLASDWLTPAEWKRVGPDFVPNSPSYRSNGFFAWTPQNGAAIPAKVSFKAPIPSRQVGHSLLIRGGDFSKLYGSSPSATPSPNTATIAGFTAPATPSLALFFGAAEVGPGKAHEPTALPANYTKVQDVYSSTDTTQGRTTTYLGSLMLPGATNLNDGTISWESTTSPTAIGLGIPQYGFVAPPDNGFHVKTADGKTASVYVQDSWNSQAPIKDLAKTHRGYKSVSDMLAETPFYWAHRGGSRSYPEHSLWAYTQSVIRGFGAIEISLSQTKDGVWFGSHDGDLSRVTKGKSTTPIVNMTWAEVQQFQVELGENGAPKPFSRWEELRDTYGYSHVIVMDPKLTPPELFPEFWAMCDSLGPERVAVKFFYTATHLADEAARRGYRTWGYLYETNLTKDPTWAEKASKWSLLGMEYFASQEAWDKVKALGKPVLGHICPDQAAVDLALSRGASGVQCSGTAAIKPTLAKQ